MKFKTFTWYYFYVKTFSVVVTVVLSLGVLFGTTEVLAQTGTDPQQFDSQIGENGESGSQFVPCSGTNCSACHFASLANNIVDWLIMMLALVFTIIVIVSGFRLVTSGGNQNAKSAAKKSVTNAFVGLLLVLAAWLVIDTIMRALVGDDGKVGDAPWGQIECWEQRRSTEIAYKPDVFVYTAKDVDETFGTVSTAGANTYSAGNCTPAKLESMGMNSTQANVFSCIAAAESNCNNNATARGSSARGIFQITRGWNDKCHNLNLPQCSAAAGVSGDLNCSQAFKIGTHDPRPGKETEALRCDKAASNQRCNVAAALCLYNNGGYGHWLGTPQAPHRKQIACVKKYGG